jgi:hypothetical protein
VGAATLPLAGERYLAAAPLPLAGAYVGRRTVFGSIRVIERAGSA